MRQELSVHSPIVLSTFPILLYVPGTFSNAPSRFPFYVACCDAVVCLENSCDRVQSLRSSPAVRACQVGIPSTRATNPDQPPRTVVGAKGFACARGHGHTHPRNSEARAATCRCADRVSIPSSCTSVRFQNPPLPSGLVTYLATIPDAETGQVSAQDGALLPFPLSISRAFRQASRPICTYFSRLLSHLSDCWW